MKAEVVLLLVCAGGLAAQPTARLRGVAYDSLHGKPLAAAYVSVAGTTRGAFSDSTGAFLIEGVQPGSIRLLLQHEVLDALGLFASATRVTVTDGLEPVVVAVPSFETLWKTVCADPPPKGEAGLLFGRVHPRKDSPKELATVSASWLELTVESGKSVRQEQKTVESQTDSLGGYAFCGVPTSTVLRLRAITRGAESGISDVLPFDARVLRKDLTLGAPVDSVVTLKRAASLSGRVVDTAQTPLAGAQILIPGLGLGAYSDRNGEFRIADVLPGSFLVSVRKIGFAALDSRLEFFEATATSFTASLSRITVLDSMQVNARPARDEAMRLFEENRKLGLGKFLTREDLDRQRDRRMVDILSQFPGLKPQHGAAGQGYLFNNRGVKSLSEPCQAPKQDHEQVMAKTSSRAGGMVPLSCTTACYVHVFLDGVDVSLTEIPNINRYDPSQLEAIEYYAGGAQVPAEFNRLNASRCGLILLHSRRGPNRPS